MINNAKWKKLDTKTYTCYMIPFILKQGKLMYVGRSQDIRLPLMGTVTEKGVSWVVLMFYFFNLNTDYTVCK